MARKLRLLFLTVELNLCLWLAVCGFAWSSPDDGGAFWRGTVGVPRFLLLAGFVFAAVVQHWAYYAIYKQLRDHKADRSSEHPQRVLS